ncbi:FGGY carbohydrate kinase domain-containing protein [Coccinella septempunctata]|uniref:FGGY carbohydrate kinase domain-containing protein n=1 Tax=Coccinella septempunctata TaxID=41139 RepID=UPI001D05F001|nr:FGGY carbohydrate kinase domain-containing protein [Coccinella septempunctata]
MSLDFFIGVDVGTGSARAGLVSTEGKVVRSSVAKVRTWNPKSDFYEQSSVDIWSACVKCIKEVARGVNPENIKGIGFDATCSLVCLDSEGKPLPISQTGDNNRNVILWMDHRARAEAEEINSKQHQLLKYVGGKISLEMETPKLLWLKRNLFETCWKKAAYFFDLPDYLTWMATENDTRSLCSLVCKWTYEASEDGSHKWNPSYFQQIGLDDLETNNWKKIGSFVQNPGSAVNNGLCKKAAEELGLKIGTPIGTSMIDAHAGALGMIGCSINGLDEDFSSKLGLICGTSTCHMAVSKVPVFCQGVWGPYYSAVIPGMWLNEGGQSATGKLIDHIIETHPATAEIQTRIGEKHIQEYLSELLERMAKRENLKSPNLLTSNLHVWPDFHGNRSPLADPGLRGSVVGLTLGNSEEDLALLYMAIIQALSYGTRHIIECLRDSGHNLKTILICGGLSKNKLFVKTQADVAKLPVVCPDEPEAVLLGSAILAASAAGYFGDMKAAIRRMGGSGTVIHPNIDLANFHDKKYKVFLKMYKDQMEYRRIMDAE